MVSQAGSGINRREVSLAAQMRRELPALYQTLNISPDGNLLVFGHLRHHHIPALTNLSAFLEILRTLPPPHFHHVVKNMMWQILPISRRHFYILSSSMDFRSDQVVVGGLPCTLGSLAYGALGLLSSYHCESSDDTQ